MADELSPSLLRQRWEQRYGWLRWVDRFTTVLAILAGIAALAMMVNIVADVIARSVARPLPGTVDLTQFAWMPIVISLGLGYALLVGQHIRVTLLTGEAAPRTQRIVEIVGMTITLATAAALAWFGVERAIAATGIAEAPASTPWLPIWVFRWVLVIGVVGLALQAAAQLVRAITVPEFDPDDDGEFELTGPEPSFADLDEALDVAADRKGTR